MGTLDYNSYIKFDNGFIREKRQDFLHRTSKEFLCKDDFVKYSRCHSVSYLSIVSSIIKAFNFVYNIKNKSIRDISYDEAEKIVSGYMSGLILAVKKFPLILSNDYKTMSVDNNYYKIINSENIEAAAIDYCFFNEPVLKLILKAMRTYEGEILVDHLLDYGNILIEVLNNCPMNLRVGPAQCNSDVHENYDIISFSSCKEKNGIIIDTELDCAVLSHVKHLMYKYEDTIKYLSPRSILLPDIYKKDDGYEIMTSFQLCDKNLKLNWIKDTSAKVFFYDWYTKEKELIEF